MSYILNALKKSEQERAGDSGTPVKAPASLEARDTAPSPGARPSWALIAGSGGMAVLVAVVVWASGYWPEANIDTDDAPIDVAALNSENVAPAPTGPNQPSDGPSSAAVDAPPPLPVPASSLAAAESSENAASVPSTEAETPATAVTTLPDPAAAPAEARTDSAPLSRPEPAQPTRDSVSAIDKARGPITSRIWLEEPASGGPLPIQRPPRSVGDGPKTSAPLLALNLEPPVPSSGLQNPVVTTAEARAVVVDPLPPPTDISPSTMTNSIPAEAERPVSAPARQESPEIVTVTPDTLTTEPRREIAAVASPRVDRASLTEAADLHERGWAFERSGNFARAIDAFTGALELRPDFADAYFGRAWIRDRSDQLEQATVDYSQALRIEPNFAAAYGSRGVARFYLDQLSEAEADFKQTLQIGRGELRRFAVLWRYLSAEHDGRNGAQQLKSDTQNINLERWPGVIARFYLDTVDAEAVLRQARDPDPAVRRERLCVAYFFIAQKHLLAGRTAQARDSFQKAVDTGVTEFIQHKAAQRELDRLSRLR